MSIIEAIFNDVIGSLRGGRPPTTGALVKLDMLFESMIHLAGGLCVLVRGRSATRKSCRFAPKRDL